MSDSPSPTTASTHISVGPPRPGTPGPKTIPGAQHSKVAYGAAVQVQRDKDWSLHPGQSLSSSSSQLVATRTDSKGEGESSDVMAKGLANDVVLN